MHGQEYVDQILTSLRVISMIKEGQKVKVRNGLLDLEARSTGIRTAFHRWIHNDNRHTTVLYIKNVISNALEISEIHPQKSEKLLLALEDCTSGLSALSVTYGVDASVTATLQVIQERIKSEIKARTDNDNK
jgi:hypothetical protein